MGCTNVFICWKEERSKRLAQALRDWLPMVLQHVKPWMSDTDIAAGQKWDPALETRLQESEAGILCLTRENLNAPWILFEAGVLSKTVGNDTRVIPLLLGLKEKDVSYPLARFQMKLANEKGLKDTVLSINQMGGEEAVAAPTLASLFKMAWPTLCLKIDAIPKEEGPAVQKRSADDLLEEVLTSVRSMETRMRSLETTLTSEQSRRRIREIMHRLASATQSADSAPKVVGTQSTSSTSHTGSWPPGWVTQDLNQEEMEHFATFLALKQAQQEKEAAQAGGRFAGKTQEPHSSTGDDSPDPEPSPNKDT